MSIIRGERVRNNVQFKRIVAQQHATFNNQQTAHKSYSTKQQTATITVKYMRGADNYGLSELVGFGFQDQANIIFVG